MARTVFFQHRHCTHIGILLLSSCVLAMLAGCSGHVTRTNALADKNAGLEITETFYHLRMHGKTEEALALFSERFFEATPRDELRGILEKVDRRHGPLSYSELGPWETIVSKGTHPFSRFTYIYEVKYRDGSTRESFVLEKEDDGKIKILIYNIFYDETAGAAEVPA